jgi:tetratricopeptide (TPR) repeat protein
MGFFDLFRPDPVMKMHTLVARANKIIKKGEHDKGENAQAFSMLNDALEISRQVGDCVCEAFILQDLGIVQYRLDDKRKALEYFKQSLKILRDKLKVNQKFPGPPLDTRVVYGAQGASHTFLVIWTSNNVYTTSIWPSRRGKPKRFDLYSNLRSTEGNILLWHGITNNALGNLQKGQQYLERALAIAREIGDQSLEEQSLQVIELRKYMS